MSQNLAGIPVTRVHVDVENMFECYCELNCPTFATNNNQNYNNQNQNNQNLATITAKYPTNFRDDKILKMVQLFAFIPCESESDAVGTFSFVLTAEDFLWRFCFCCYNLDENSIMVILSRLPWHDTFFKMLSTLTDLKSRNANEFNSFLTSCYKAKVPTRGEMTLVAIGGSRRVFALEQPSFYKLPAIPDNHNLTVFYQSTTPKIMLALIASLMQERRIIITSSKPDRHSACVQAANALLYPMEWQHIFIPILPIQLRDYLMGPMPYLIGVHTSVLDTICRGELGDAIIFNCDLGTYESCRDDVQLLPKHIVLDVKNDLRQAHQKRGEYISYVFLVMMVRLLGHYRDGIKFESDAIFSEAAFLSKRHPSKRKFLRTFLYTSMCVHFVATRLSMLRQEPVIWDRFEMECALHSQHKKRRCCGRSKKKFKETNEIYLPLDSFQNQLFKCLEVTESIKLELERLRKSKEYENAKTHADMRELFESLRHILVYGSSAYSSLQAQNAEELKNLGYTEIHAKSRSTDMAIPEKMGSSKTRYNG
ncbi:unnamed protein product [Ceratitis capitata]|uniref:(Mediterranean fruit fly) hypothetical protein n=1 Tax=Ceratitis capitata TaxID=7213 RepID=A0A811VD87_CERCA|nr:unnamed protein product [Ceratitis capitata]